MMSSPPSERSALIVVDMQPDFMPGGSLAVAGGHELLKPIGWLLESDQFELCVATQDWHPPDHVSFASNHPGQEPLDTIELYGHPQILWPDHCVQGTPGAALHADLPTSPIAAIVRKATDPDVDSYSAFRNNWNRAGERPPTGLAGYLRERGVTDVYLCGLARDFCVQWSAEDGVDAGFEVHVFWDLTRPVEPESNQTVLANLKARGVEIIRTSEPS
jgi:nicotinamidase/pyrazinamidase